MVRVQRMYKMSRVPSSLITHLYISLCVLSKGVDVLLTSGLLCSLADRLKLLIADNITLLSIILYLLSALSSSVKAAANFSKSTFWLDYLIQLWCAPLLSLLCLGSSWLQSVEYLRILIFYSFHSGWDDFSSLPYCMFPILGTFLKVT